MFTLLTLLVGLFIGWNIPQPAIAKLLQEKLIARFRNAGK